MAQMTIFRHFVPRRNRPYLTDREIRNAYLWMPIFFIGGCLVLWLFDPSPWLWVGLLIVALACGIGFGWRLGNLARTRMFRERIWKETR